MIRPISIVVTLLFTYSALESAPQVAEAKQPSLSQLEAFDVSICGLNKTRDLTDSKFYIRNADNESRRSGGSRATNWDGRAGYYARAGEFPWLVSMEIHFENKTISCAGTLIHRDLVISSANCFHNRESTLR